jgi:hypothetical protein
MEKLLNSIKGSQMATQTTLRFFYNGIKGSDGILQKGTWFKLSNGNIMFYAKDYSRLSKEVKKAFNVLNETDSQVDYFESDKFMVKPSHKFYQDCLKANNDYIAKFNARMAKKEEKRKAIRA